MDPAGPLPAFHDRVGERGRPRSRLEGCRGPARDPERAKARPKVSPVRIWGRPAGPTASSDAFSSRDRLPKAPDDPHSCEP